MPATRRHSWRIIAVAFVATALGGAYIGFQKGGGFGNPLSQAVIALLQRAEPVAKGPAREASARKGPRGKDQKAAIEQTTNELDDSLASILRHNDEAALNRLLPRGINVVEGAGGMGLGRQVKSYGIWFPVFDLSQAKRKSSSELAEEDVDDVSVYEPNTVELTKVPLMIVETALPRGIVDEVLRHRFAALGGVPPYQWSMQADDLRFILDPATGEFSGSSPEPLSIALSVFVTDAEGSTASTRALLVIEPREPLAIATETLPEALVGEPYSARLMAEGGQPPYEWRVSSPTGGWTCDSAGGLITSHPEEVGEAVLEVTVSDGQSEVTRAFMVTISEGLNILTESPLPPAAPGMEYTGTFEASGGTPPYRWSIVGGSLPSQWMLSAEGDLRGMVGKGEASHRFQVQVLDSNGKKARRSFEVAIRQGLIAVPSFRKVGLAWKLQDMARKLGVSLAGVSVLRNGMEIYQGSGSNAIDRGLAPGGRCLYSLNAITSDGRVLPYSAATVQVLPMTKQKGSPGAAGDPFVDQVVSFLPLSPNGYGSAQAPYNVLGPPQGRSTYSPAYLPQEVLSLHASTLGGGSIILEFRDNIVENGPGLDFTVFENVFFEGNDPNNRFMEPAIVEVALFEGEWYRFPVSVSPPAADEANLQRPDYYAEGFAGVNGATGDDPTDPTRSGGDSFDLARLGAPQLNWIRFIRLRATGDRVQIDRQGLPVQHTSKNKALTGNASSGFDLDAISAVNY